MMKWMDMLREHLAGEGKDHDAYMKLAEMAEKDGCFCEAGVLRDIAREEHTHHKLIKEMMEDMPEAEKNVDTTT